MIAKLKDWLANFLPYSLESWKGLLEHYHQIWWPYSLCVLVLVLILLWSARVKLRATLWLLAASWAWSGWFFLGNQFVTLNWSAKYFSWLFLLQALLLIVFSMGGRIEQTRSQRQPQAWQSIIVLFAMLILPLVQLISGYQINQLGWFALTPDATALTTIALLGVWRFLPAVLIAIPVIWSVIVFANSWPLNDVAGMSVLPLTVLLLIFFKLHQLREAHR